MKQPISFVLVTALAFLCLFCGQNDNKKKELELKEREIALKEKEFALKQNDSTLVQTNTPTKTAQQKSTNDIGENFLGIWKYRDANNEDAFLKIIKENNGRFNLQEGHNYGNKINWGENLFSTANGEYLKLSNGSLAGKYRNWEGSAPDAYSDIKIRLALKTENILLFKSDVHTGGGNSYNELHEATKID